MRVGVKSLQGSRISEEKNGALGLHTANHEAEDSHTPMQMSYADATNYGSCSTSSFAASYSVSFSSKVCCANLAPFGPVCVFI